jgi:hypothetical protein
MSSRTQPLVLLVTLLLSLLTTSLSAMSLSPEHEVATPVLQPAGGVQRSPLVASDGIDFMVAWYDSRSAEPESDTRFTLVRRDGTVVSPTGETIPGSGQPAALLRARGEYIVGTHSRQVIRLDDEGRVLGAGSLPFTGVTLSIRYASNGDSLLAFFRETDGNQFTLYTFTSDTELRSPRITPVSVTGFGQNTLLAAAGMPGGNYLLAWRHSEPSELFVMRISPSGELLDPAPISLGNVPLNASPAVAGGSDGWLVTLTTSNELATSNEPATWVASIAPSGAVRLPLTRITEATSGRPIPTPGGFLLPATRTGAGAEMISLRSDGAPLVTSSLSGEPGVSVVSGAAASDRVLVTFSEGPITLPHLSLAMTDLSGRLLGGDAGRRRPLTFSAMEQWASALATDGDRYLVAWTTVTHNGQWQLRAGRMTSDGSLLEGEGLLLSATADFNTTPAAAFDGRNFVVVWRESVAPFQPSRLLATRISTQGIILDTPPLLVSDGAGPGGDAELSVASNGDDTAVLYHSVFPSGLYSMVVSRISRDGAVLDPGGRAVAAGAAQLDLASDGIDYFAVWATGGTLHGSKIFADGTIWPPKVLRLNSSRPRIAWGGSRYLITSSDSTTYLGSISGGLYDTVGTPVSPEFLYALRSGRHDLAFDGQRFVLAWEHPARFLPPPPIGAPPIPVYDIRARWIGVDGVPMHSIDGATISADWWRDERPAVAGAGGAALIVYTRPTPEKTGVKRVLGRFLSASSPRQRPVRGAMGSSE